MDELPQQPVEPSSPSQQPLPTALTEPPKNHHWWIVSGVLGVALIVGSAGAYYYSQNNVSSSSAELDVSTTTSPFVCTKNYAACHQIDGRFQLTALFLDGDWSAVLPSPDHELAIRVEPKEVILINTKTLEMKIVSAGIHEEFGYWSAMPSFVPQAKWLNNTQVELSIYKEGTFEVYPDIQNSYDQYRPPDPIERKIVDISEF